jgi:hypothetical protein
LSPTTICSRRLRYSGGGASPSCWGRGDCEGGGGSWGGGWEKGADVQVSAVDKTTEGGTVYAKMGKGKGARKPWLPDVGHA